MFNQKNHNKMKASEDVPDVFQEKEIATTLLTDEEMLELHIKDELQKMEEFFSKEFDEMDLRFQEYETIY